MNSIRNGIRGSVENMKKVCLLFCGGTITMKRSVGGTLKPFYGPDDLLKFAPDLTKFAHVTPYEEANIDSSNFYPQLWTKLTDAIIKHEEDFDAFVVTHGTDTMAYTASALSYPLRYFRKPVVFTGAQKPMEDVPNDATTNLINAILVATTLDVGVSIVFGRKILQGNLSTKVSESSLDAFDSPMARPLGTISLEPQLINPDRAARLGVNWQHTTFDPAIVEIQIVPGLSTTVLDAVIEAKCHGLILQGFGPGNIPDSLLPFFYKAKKKRLPVVMLSQCLNGITQMKLYDVGKRALELGAIPGGDMTSEAATTKLMWILSQTQDIDQVRKIFQANIAGEVTSYAD